MSCCSTGQEQMCPMRMNDGRIFTDYRPKCMINSELILELDKNNIVSSHDSRMFLQQNAESIMQKYKTNAELISKCGNFSKTTVLPEKYIVKCDTVSCKRLLVNQDGIGDGRSY